MVKIKYFFCLVDWGAMSDVSDDTNELIVIDEGNLLTLDGLPEPQIGPQSGLTLQMPGAVFLLHDFFEISRNKNYFKKFQ